MLYSSEWGKSRKLGSAFCSQFLPPEPGLRSLASDAPYDLSLGSCVVLAHSTLRMCGPA